MVVGPRVLVRPASREALAPVLLPMGSITVRYAMAPRFTRCAQVRPDGELPSTACRWPNQAGMVGTYLESQQKYGPRSGRVHRQVSCLRCGGLQKAQTDGSAQFRGVSAGDSLLATGCSASLAGCQVRPNGGICSPVVRPTPRVLVVLLEPSACANTSHDPVGLAALLQTNTDTKEPRSLERDLCSRFEG